MDKLTSTSEGATNRTTNISDNCNDDDVNNYKHVDTPTSNTHSAQHTTISDSETDKTNNIANKTDGVVTASLTSRLAPSDTDMQGSNGTTQDQGHCNKKTENADQSPSAGVISEAYSLLLVNYNSISDSDSDSSESDDFCNISKNATDSSNNATSISTQSNGDMDEDSNVINTFSGESVSNRNYRNNIHLSSDSSDSECESSSEDEGAKCNREIIKEPVKDSPLSKELQLDRLPPVSDLSKLSLNVKKEDCIQMGKVSSIIEKLVVIDSLPEVPAYNLDTVLFMNEGNDILGQVYDVIGNVNNPTYVVRFNSEDEIHGKGIAKGLPVYSAPKSQHCKYVFVQELMKNKGTDASWVDDQECPDEFLDLSDDEKEKQLKSKKLESKKRKHSNMNKHKIFEATMNFKNKLDTARHKIRDPIVNTSKPSNQPNSQPAAYYYNMPPTPVNPQTARQACTTGYTPFPPSFATPPPPFNYVGIHPAMMNFAPFPNQFGPRMAPFPGNYQQYPPPNFCPPNIPPMPPMTPHHMVPQSSPLQPYTQQSVNPQHMLALNTSKQSTNVPKSPPKPSNGNQHGGVVPKTCKGRPRAYNSAPQPSYPPNIGLPNSSMPPFGTLPPGIPPPFGPPIPAWGYNIPNPLPPPNQPPTNQAASTLLRPNFQYGIPYQKH